MWKLCLLKLHQPGWDVGVQNRTFTWLSPHDKSQTHYIKQTISSVLRPRKYFFHYYQIFVVVKILHSCFFLWGIWERGIYFPNYITKTLLMNKTRTYQCWSLIIWEWLLVVQSNHSCKQKPTTTESNLWIVIYWLVMLLDSNSSQVQSCCSINCGAVKTSTVYS